MTVSELLAKPWLELAAISAQAIEKKDGMLLETIDLVFHQMFLDELWATKGGDWDALTDRLL